MSHPQDPPQDRHVAVSGAGTGIGRAVALRLAREGALLSLFARDLARLEATAALAREAGSPGVFCAACDIRDRASIARTFEAIREAQGPLNALVANSGIGGPNRPQARGEDRFDNLVATNLGGTYHCLRAAQEILEPGPRTRHFVLVSSILGRIGVAGYSGYCASKAGLLGLTRALAAELAPEGVQVNAVCPGWVDTEMAQAGLRDMAAQLDSDQEEALRIAMSAVPMRRMSQPEDVAGLVSWLLSEDARGVTGQGLDMNNGAFMI